jgi:hypothetical protein
MKLLISGALLLAEALLLYRQIYEVRNKVPSKELIQE